MNETNLFCQNLKIGIIGGGPAGLLSAYLFARAGAKVTVLEKNNSIPRKVCGEYLAPSGVQKLAQLGLLDRLCHGFEKIYGMKIYSAEETLVPTHFPQTTNYAYGLSLNRKIFEERLYELCRQHQVEMIFGKAVQNLEELKSFQFDFIIAADGRHSTIGKWLDLNLPLKEKKVAYHINLKPEDFDQNQIERMGEMHLFSTGDYCGLNPIDDGEINFSIVCSQKIAQQFKHKHELVNYFIRQSSNLSNRFKLLKHDSAIKTAFPLRHQMKGLWKDKIVFVGDAASFLDPLTGEGIFNAIQSSVLLYESMTETKNIKQAFIRYEKSYKDYFFPKKIINNFFQWIIKKPILCELIASFLNKSQVRRDSFVGIIGNLFTPYEGLRRMLLCQK